MGPIVPFAWTCYKQGRQMENAATLPDYVTLYQQAFDRFGALALWNKKRLEHPEPGHALVVARALRFEGNMAARRLAEQIEQACRAAV